MLWFISIRTNYLKVKLGSCKILAKYGENAYKVDLPVDMRICTTFNVEDLVAYKGPTQSSTLAKDLELQDIVATLPKPSTSKLQAEKILSFKVHKVMRNKIYMKNLVKWQGKIESEDMGVVEGDFKKKGIDLSLIPS